MASRLTQIARTSPQYVNQRRDDHDDASADAITAYQQWAEGRPNPDYDAIRETLAWAKGHKVSLGALQMYHDSKRK